MLYSGQTSPEYSPSSRIGTNFTNGAPATAFPQPPSIDEQTEPVDFSSTTEPVNFSLPRPHLDYVADYARTASCTGPEAGYLSTQDRAQDFRNMNGNLNPKLL